MKFGVTTTPPGLQSNAGGSAIIAVLGALALLSLLLVSLLHSVRIERKSAHSATTPMEARLAAESAVATACARLRIGTSHYPSFLVGLEESEDPGASGGTAPLLLIGATNLTTKSQLLPLFSSDLKSAASFPKLPHGYFESLLEKRLSTNLSQVVDLNDPSLVSEIGEKTKGEAGGIIAPHGRYPALWQYLHDSTGTSVARYAFVMTDESARLNPALHRGNARTNATNWDGGPGDIPITNASGSLFSPEEAERLHDSVSTLPTEGSMETALEDPSEFHEKRGLLTRDPCRLPDLIPAGYPEQGLPKYNLNNLATNPAWGATPYDRATNIAGIINKNLPSFKLRDPSLPAKEADLYLRRLACSIVDYISPTVAPTGPSPEEPLGRDLVPYVTQIAECCTRKSLSSNSTVIESRFFAEIWNPTTKTIPAGGTARLRISNRAKVIFGNDLETAFQNYDRTTTELPSIRPNEFIVVAFDPTEQTWTSPTATTNFPKWDGGPSGNEDGTQHQHFQLYWNGALADMTRRAGTMPGDVAGGLVHLAQTLNDTKPHWQCFTVPTWASGGTQPVVADQAIQPGDYRFVGDPRATFLTAYKWQSMTNYPLKTLWKGINPATRYGAGFVLDPQTVWKARDRVPVNGPAGAKPADDLQNPDKIPSPYREEADAANAPFVMRKGPMNSLAELGNIFDPAQVDDTGDAPQAGSPKQSKFCSGGGRTLRVGQPEFHAANPKFTWDVPGKRAVDLIDLFTVSEPSRQPGTNRVTTNSAFLGIPGRINVNTAPHAVLTALFTGVGVTSDRRFTNCVLSAKAVEELANLLEEHRPYARLSDLSLLTTNLVNADSYLPRLAENVVGSTPPIANVFDRAREEAFGRIIGHCAVQSRTFRIYVIGEALDRSGKTSARSLLEGLIRLTPDSSGTLVPSLHDVTWH
jgi:hypothetical protein